MGGFNPPGEQRPVDAEPRWLPKAPNDPTGPGGPIPFPEVVKSETLQAEAELAVVVGATLSRASVGEAAAGIFGWTAFNDVTAFEMAWDSMMYFSVAKSLDGFAAFGPWVRTDLTEARVMEGLAIIRKVNDTNSQSGNTKYYKFTPSEMLSHISQHVTLHPADIVTLGTPYPPGGRGRRPGRCVRRGGGYARQRGRLGGGLPQAARSRHNAPSGQHHASALMAALMDVLGPESLPVPRQLRHVVEAGWGVGEEDGSARMRTSIWAGVGQAMERPAVSYPASKTDIATGPSVGCIFVMRRTYSTVEVVVSAVGGMRMASSGAVHESG